MSAPYKSVSEQRIARLERLRRPLTEEESDELRRAMHAAYERKRRRSKLVQHRCEELKLLKKLNREAKLSSDLA
jgi:hypothetical protein